MIMICKRFAVVTWCKLHKADVGLNRVCSDPERSLHAGPPDDWCRESVCTRREGKDQIHPAFLM